MSYVFYSWWIGVLSLIIFSTLIDYSIGQMLKFMPIQKEDFVKLSILINIDF